MGSEVILGYRISGATMDNVDFWMSRWVTRVRMVHKSTKVSCKIDCFTDGNFGKILVMEDYIDRSLLSQMYTAKRGDQVIFKHVQVMHTENFFLGS